MKFSFDQLKAFLSCSLLLFAFSAMAQVGSLSGTVSYPGGKAAEFVHVQLKGTDKGTITDTNGRYSITALTPGVYTLLFTHISILPQERKVEIKVDKVTNVPNVTVTEAQAELAEVVINANRSQRYTADIPSSSLRLQGPLLETPQNIQVIPQQLIEDQQSIDMLESVSRNVSGVQMIEHWGNFARVNMRGFKIPAFRNGMNVDMPWGPLSEDLSVVERIEFVKGPAGFMLSSGEPGGLYNVVTKTPQLNQQQEVTLTMGSFNTLRSTLDIGGAVENSNRLQYRLNLMALTKGAHRAYEFNNRFTLAPSLRYQLSAKTSVTASYLYQYSQMSVVGAAYVFSPTGFADLPRDFTFAEPNIDPTNINEHSGFLTLTHEFSPAWQVTAQLGYLNYQQTGSSLWPDSVAENGDVIRGLNSWDALNEAKLGQVFVNGAVTTGAIGHKLLAGIDIGHKDYYADWFQGGSIDTAENPFNVYAPQYERPSNALPVFDRSSSIRTRAFGTYAAIVGQRYSSLYLQDELSFLKNSVRLTLAGRYTYFNGWSYGASSKDRILTPRAGLSITPIKNTSVYALFDQSFIPQTGVDITGKALEPVTASNMEAGIKRDWANGRWKSTVAVFKITKNNEPTAYPENPYAYYQLGQVVSKGVEVDVQGELAPGLHLILNYATTEVEITEDLNEEMVGDRVAGHARHMTNGWLNYQFQGKYLKGIGASIGYQYQADRSSWNWGADNSSELPNYFRLDGALSWRNDSFSAALNVNNLLNDYLYSGSAYGTYYYWQAEPGTNFRIQLGYTF